MWTVTRTARPGPDRRGAGDVRRLRALGPIATPARYDVWGGGYLSVDVLGYSMSAAYDIPKTTHSALVHRMHNESGDIGTRILDRAEVRAMVPGLGDRV